MTEAGPRRIELRPRRWKFAQPPTGKISWRLSAKGNHYTNTRWRGRPCLVIVIRRIAPGAAKWVCLTDNTRAGMVLEAGDMVFSTEQEAMQFVEREVALNTLPRDHRAALAEAGLDPITGDPGEQITAAADVDLILAERLKRRIQL